MNEFWNIFTFGYASYAIAAGFLVGSTFVLWFSLHYRLLAPLSTRAHAGTAFLASLILGAVFFAGQIFEGQLGDPLWPRALGRLGVWILFSASLGLGLGISRSFAHRPDPRNPATPQGPQPEEPTSGEPKAA